VTFYCHDAGVEHDGRREYSIGELADEAGVSTRTIRYYVSEGLLPPPAGGGPNSRYTDAHRDQLETIGRLKAQYLPLKEIRRRLIGHGPLLNAPPEAQEDSPASAPRTEGWRRADPLDAEEWRRRSVADEDVASPLPMEHRLESIVEPTRRSAAMPPPAPDEDGAPLWLAPVPAGERTWRRVAISDESELLITESLYRRHRDKIDWLAQWARRVLDG
jgi:DNA-binding transcriptional MerR regulator